MFWENFLVEILVVSFLLGFAAHLFYQVIKNQKFKKENPHLHFHALGRLGARKDFTCEGKISKIRVIEINENLFFTIDSLMRFQFYNLYTEVDGEMILLESRTTNATNTRYFNGFEGPWNVDVMSAVKKAYDAQKKEERKQQLLKERQIEQIKNQWN